MKSNFYRETGVLAAALAVSTPAQAKVQIPGIETIETRLCPVGGPTSLRLGQPRQTQDPALRAAFSFDGVPIAPFTESRAVYTHWSDRLSAVEFNAASPDGADNRAFVEGIGAVLEANGWVRANGPVPKAVMMMEPHVFEKTLPTADGPRLMVLQFEASGAVALNCGDPELMRLSAEEEIGELAPNSPRPVKPAELAQQPANFSNEDCSRPELRDNLIKLLNADDSASVTGAFDQADAQERYQDRLRTWLRWKIVSSGKVSDEQLWRLEDRVLPTAPENIEKDFVDFAGDLTAAHQARTRGDKEGECRALARMISAETGKAKATTGRLVKVNAALEAEARRLGVALD